MKKKWNALDIFLCLFALLVVASIYFSFIRPVKFSNLIRREGTKWHAEVDIILANEWSWIKDFIPVGDRRRDVYGEVEWEVLGIENVKLGGVERVKVRVKVAAVEETSGILRYGKYVLSKGGSIQFIGDKYTFGGYIYNYKLLGDKVAD